MRRNSVTLKLMFSKKLTQTILRAVRIRLEAILLERLNMHKRWEENIQHKLKPSRQKEVRRKHEKVIQALKIVIHELTPYHERDGDEPTAITRKDQTK